MKKKWPGMIQVTIKDKGIIPIRPGGGFFLYRFYDERGTLLYIGKTNNLIKRLESHRRTTPWWNEVTSIRWECLQVGETTWTSPTGLWGFVEREAIRSEQPRYNRAGRTSQPQQVTYRR